MIPKKITEALQKLQPIYLHQMDSVTLMDRTDVKYLFHRDRLPALLEELANDYYVLEVEDVRYTDYESVYFDTPDFHYYLLHHNYRVDRYKIRYRKYLNSGLTFFEIKHKNNKGWTTKSRIKRDKIRFDLEGESAEFVRKKSPIAPENLEAKVNVYYTRVTLVSFAMNERVTLDLNLTYTWKEQKVSYENLIVLEDKVGGNIITPTMRVLKKNHIRPYGISKYCIGVTKIYPSIKQNSFKPKLLTLNKFI